DSVARARAFAAQLFREGIVFELSGLIVSGIGVIHDLIHSYADLQTWREEDITVDDEWLPLAIEKGILAGPLSDYTWSSEHKIPTRELRGTHQVVVAFNEEKK